MIDTAQQLKGLIRNLSKGDSTKAQVLIRNYATERFLERVSLSPYRNNLILKGGTLIASMVGLDARSTMDIDATIRNRPLTEDSVSEIIGDIIAIPLEDGMRFDVVGVQVVMDEADYPGIRVLMEASLDRIRIPMKIDFSTDDAITPREVSHSMHLMFEDRSISILAYNLETVLAEKMETVLSRGVANTRMRDFYDLHILGNSRTINHLVLREAFLNTCVKRSTEVDGAMIGLIMNEIESSQEMANLWGSYQRKFDYAAEVEWPAVLVSINQLFERTLGERK